MMKISQTIILTAIKLVSLAGLANVAQAQELPAQAKTILNKLEQYEEREQKSLERKIVKEKKDVLKSLERSQKRVKNQGQLKLYDKQIRELKEEIAASEMIVKGESADKIVKFGVVYHYGFSLKQFTEKKGELTFFEDNKAKIVHKELDGKVASDDTLKWKFIDGRLVISGVMYGDIIISPKERGKREELNMKWARLKKTTIAKTN